MLNLIYIASGLFLGVFVAWLMIKVSKAKILAEKNYIANDLQKLQSEMVSLREQNSTFTTEIGGLNAEKQAQNQIADQFKLEFAKKYGEISELQNKLETTKQQISDQRITIAEKNNKIEAIEEKLKTQKQDLENIQEKFSDTFKNLANEILDDKSSRFTKLNQQNLDAILTPLQNKILEFQKTVQETNEKNLVSNSGLIEQIINLKEMNKQISEEANNLTKALKGDVKVQGNWGEVILERILEESGLRKGEEYETQASFTVENGKRFQPDVIIHLPDSKDIIVDSKVSLVSYENFVAADSEDMRLKEVKLLATSVRAHIDGLHKKHYHELKELNTPDFVLLFMPIEGSFATVMQFDNNLYKYALDKHIVIVSPSTLLATLRTIAFIWRQENQTKNALEIARQSGALYDKFEGFLSDLEKIGINVDRTKEAYDKAVNKLKTGKGNLVGRAEKLKQLGAKTNKSISDKFLPIEEDI